MVRSVLRLERTVFDAICALAFREYPLEMCGLIAGEPGADHAVRFYDHHRMLGFGRDRWRTVTGGSRTYVDAIVDRLRGESKMSSRIVVEALLLVSWWALRDRVLRRRAPRLR